MSNLNFELINSSIERVYNGQSNFMNTFDVIDEKKKEEIKKRFPLLKPFKHPHFISGKDCDTVPVYFYLVILGDEVIKFCKQCMTNRNSSNRGYTEVKEYYKYVRYLWEYPYTRWYENPEYGYGFSPEDVEVLRNQVIELEQIYNIDSETNSFWTTNERTLFGYFGEMKHNLNYIIKKMRDNIKSR